MVVLTTLGRVGNQKPINQYQPNHYPDDHSLAHSLITSQTSAPSANRDSPLSTDAAYLESNRASQGRYHADPFDRCAYRMAPWPSATPPQTSLCSPPGQLCLPPCSK